MMMKRPHFLNPAAVANIVDRRERIEIERSERAREATAQAEEAERVRILALLAPPWTEVACDRVGPFWRLSGTFAGVSHSGVHRDGDVLAANLIAAAGATPPAAPQIAPVQSKTLQVLVAPAPARSSSDELAVVSESGPEYSGFAVVDLDDAGAEAPSPQGSRLVAFDPGSWRSLGEAVAALQGEIEREHAQRTLARQRHLDRVLELGDDDSDTATVERAQHRQWAAALTHVDVVRAEKLGAVAGLASIDDARTFATTLTEGWER
jgi:hypothetical protein